MPISPQTLKRVQGLNYFAHDKLLQRILAREFDPDRRQRIFSNLLEFGKLCGGKLSGLIEEAHQPGKLPALIKYDPRGNRVDHIEYCLEQKLARKIVYDFGILNLDEQTGYPFSGQHRMALWYLLNQNGEGGVACPLAMTQGLIELLRESGTPEQKEKHLPLLCGIGSKSHFMAGQFITEIQGGSNVSANETTAALQKNGKWSLNGTKWFCSNPGDLWVTTAKVQQTQTVGLFLASRWRAAGKLNGHHILRVKDIIGTRGKATCEIEYRDLEAEPIGRPSHGLALLNRVLKVSRIGVAAAGIGAMRRAYMEALLYAEQRQAYGRPIIEFPPINKTLLEMKLIWTAGVLAAFRMHKLIEEKDPSQDLLVPLLKYKISSLASAAVKDAQMVLGGNGMLADYSILPRLAADMTVNETWEGTHHILAAHAVKAFGRMRIRNAFWREINASIRLAEAENIVQLSDCASILNHTKTALLSQIQQMKESGPLITSLNALKLCNQIYSLFVFSLLVKEAVVDIRRKKTDFLYLIHVFLDLSEAEPGAPVSSNSVFCDQARVLKALRADLPE
ncbi:MAG: acyl-CoA dehydrogenase family protein [Elusimicrobia bacterium]|nr:acyl-CoA dehydrogenase family protein [Elusimicrobiota bacterium]